MTVPLLILLIACTSTKEPSYDRTEGAMGVTDDGQQAEPPKQDTGEQDTGEQDTGEQDTGNAGE